jgi:3-oxoacyl-(acyl-carrier-protein) synthase
MEKEEDAGRKKVYARLSGFGNASDSYHPSSLSEKGEGPFRSMQRALAGAGLEPGQIGFINAHGTATENNDEVESHAMIRLFGEVPSFASTKSNTGHTLGASGAIESVFSIWNLFHQEIYPGLHFSESFEPGYLTPVITYTRKKLNHVMSNSFGFGGNCTSLVFSKV